MWCSDYISLYFCLQQENCMCFHSSRILCLLHWEKPNPTPLRTQMILQRTVNCCTFLIIHFFWLIYVVIGLSQLTLEFYFCWFGANRKKPQTNNPQKDEKELKSYIETTTEEKSNTHSSPLPHLSLVLRCLFLLFSLYKVTRVWVFFFSVGLFWFLLGFGVGFFVCLTHTIFLKVFRI